MYTILSTSCSNHQTLHINDIYVRHHLSSYLYSWFAYDPHHSIRPPVCHLRSCLTPPQAPANDPPSQRWPSNSAVNTWCWHVSRSRLHLSPLGVRSVLSCLSALRVSPEGGGRVLEPARHTPPALPPSSVILICHMVINKIPVSREFIPRTSLWAGVHQQLWAWATPRGQSNYWTFNLTLTFHSSLFRAVLLTQTPLPPFPRDPTSFSLFTALSDPCFLLLLFSVFWTQSNSSHPSQKLPTWQGTHGKINLPLSFPLRAQMTGDSQRRSLFSVCFFLFLRSFPCFEHICPEGILVWICCSWKSALLLKVNLEITIQIRVRLLSLFPTPKENGLTAAPCW